MHGHASFSHSHPLSLSIDWPICGNGGLQDASELGKALLYQTNTWTATSDSAFHRSYGRARKRGWGGGDRGKLELELFYLTLAGLLWLPLLLFPLFLSQTDDNGTKTGGLSSSPTLRQTPMDHDGRTPLHFDAWTELRAGRDVKDNDGWTSLLLTA